MTSADVHQARASGRPIKIAVLIGTLEVGGAELDIVRNFPRLNRDEFEVVVVCFQSRGLLRPSSKGRASGWWREGRALPSASREQCSSIRS